MFKYAQSLPLPSALDIGLDIGSTLALDRPGLQHAFTGIKHALICMNRYIGLLICCSANTFDRNARFGHSRTHLNSGSQHRHCLLTDDACNLLTLSDQNGDEQKKLL